MSTTADRELATPDPGDFGQPPRFLGPFVDAVARVKATVHHELLAGFLLIALLLLSMGVLCVVVLDRINGQVVRLTLLSNQVNQARQMIYEVTAQSHFRAMALLTDPTTRTWTDKIYAAKAEFGDQPVAIRTYAFPRAPESFDGSPPSTSSSGPRAMRSPGSTISGSSRGRSTRTSPRSTRCRTCSRTSSTI